MHDLRWSLQKEKSFHKSCDVAFERVGRRRGDEGVPEADPENQGTNDLLTFGLEWERSLDLQHVSSSLWPR